MTEAVRKGTFCREVGEWVGSCGHRECGPRVPIPVERYYAFYTADCPDCGRALHAEVQILNGPRAGALPPSHLTITCTGQGHAPRAVQTVFVQEDVR